MCGRSFFWNFLYTPVVYYQIKISIDKVGKSKHNKTLLRYKESKDRQHISAFLL